MNENNVFLQSEKSFTEPEMKKVGKECPPGFYVNGKCTETTVSIDSHLWVLVVVAVIIIKLTTKKR